MENIRIEKEDMDLFNALWACCSKELKPFRREWLEQIFLDRENGKLVATNGKVMLVAKAPGYIMEQCTKKFYVYEYGFLVACDKEFDYPIYQRVIPKKDETVKEFPLSENPKGATKSTIGFANIMQVSACSGKQFDISFEKAFRLPFEKVYFLEKYQQVVLENEKKGYQLIAMPLVK